MSLFRKCAILLAGLAASQIMAKTVSHTVASGISTAAADSLESLLTPGDTLWIRANNGLSLLGTGINLELNYLTLILDADANRDGTGTLASGFIVKSTGTNTQVRVLMGKNSKVGSTVTTPYHKDNFPLIEISSNPNPNVYPYIFNLASNAKLDVLFMLNSRSDMDQLASILAVGNGPFVNEGYLNASSTKNYRYGYALGSDIDMGNTPTTAMSSTLNPFRAVFDGLHHSLQKLSINSTQDSIGLFHNTKFAVIRNLDIASVQLQGKNYVGAIAGAIDSLTDLSNIRILSGSISGNNYVAGITGISQNVSSITHAFNNTAINGTLRAGGIVGVNFGKLEHLENRGHLTSSSGKAAGIVNESYSGLGIHNAINYGTITGSDAAGILSFSPTDSLVHVYNYGSITGSQKAAGISTGIAPTSLYLLNNGKIISSAGVAGGIAAGSGSGVINVFFATNTGSASGNQGAGTLYAGAGDTRHILNTGNISTTANTAYGNCIYGNGTKFSLVSASITGPNTQAVCGPYYAIGPKASVYNTDLAPSVGNYNNSAFQLDHSTLRDFANYPEPDSFKVFWHAPTTYTLPTPKDLFPNGRIYKKLRQDALVRATNGAFDMESIQTYLPTYGTDWTYACITRNSRATCSVGASKLTITQNYNVTGNETLVLEATHASGLVVRDSLLLTFSTARKSTPELSVNWPAQIVVTEGTPTLIDLSKYITDADGEAMTYVASPSQYVTSDISNGVWTLMYNNLIGTETLTLQATDAGSRTSPMASVAVSVSTLPKLVQALPALALAKTEVRVISLKTHFFDADGDALVYTLSGQKNTEAQITGDVLQIVMNSDQGDSLVITATDDDNHSIQAGLKVAGTASALLASTPASALWFQTARQQLTVHAAQYGTAQLLVRDIAGEARHLATLHLRQGTSQHSLPALPSGNYLITLRQGSQEQTQAWKQP